MGTTFGYEGKMYRVERVSLQGRRFVFWDNHTGAQIGWVEPEAGGDLKIVGSQSDTGALIRELVRAAADIGALPTSWEDAVN